MFLKFGLDFLEFFRFCIGKHSKGLMDIVNTEVGRNEARAVKWEEKTALARDRDCEKIDS